MTTPEEIRSYALERVVETLTNAWADSESPLARGMHGDGYDQELLDEMNRIYQGLQAESVRNPTPTMVWEAVNGSGFYESWWQHISYSKGACWNVPGIVTVVVDNPNGGKAITKKLSALDLLHA